MTTWAPGLKRSSSKRHYKKLISNACYNSFCLWHNLNNLSFRPNNQINSTFLSLNKDGFTILNKAHMGWFNLCLSYPSNSSAFSIYLPFYSPLLIPYPYATFLDAEPIQRLITRQSNRLCTCKRFHSCPGIKLR